LTCVRCNSPFCTGGNDYPGYPDVIRLRETVQEADALILASPEYHGSVSGCFEKCPGFDEF
jgi:NAD(P)H-dependent FMN reductase